MRGANSVRFRWTPKDACGNSASRGQAERISGPLARRVAELTKPPWMCAKMASFTPALTPKSSELMMRRVAKMTVGVISDQLSVIGHRCLKRPAVINDTGAP